MSDKVTPPAGGTDETGREQARTRGRHPPVGDLGESWDLPRSPQQQHQTGNTQAETPNPQPARPTTWRGFARRGRTAQAVPAQGSTRELGSVREPGTVLRSRQKRDSEGVRGIARAVDLRHEQNRKNDLLTFRVDRYDASGNRLPPVPVELRGLAISGKVSDGEEVLVSGTWRRGTLRASRIVNVSTGADIHQETFFGLLADSVRRHRLATGVVLVALVALVASVAVAASLGGGTIRGPSRVTLPDVIGLTAVQAKGEIAFAGIDLSDVQVRGNQFCPVVETEPPAGSTISDGMSIVLVLGPGTGTNAPGCG